jgi:cytosine/adenosine deaminase-related metal-dependent hydrolase
LSGHDIRRVNRANPRIAHNPRSNMNNAVGYAPIEQFTCPIQLGTDGIGADLFAEAKAAWFKSRDGHANISPNDVIQMLANSARCASKSLGVTVGKLQVGAAADVVITDYVPFTPLTTDNFAGHFLFAMSAKSVRHVIANGKVVLQNRLATSCDEEAIRAKSRDVAAKLWKRMEDIPA